MPLDLSWINLSLVGWIVILVAAVLLTLAVLRFFGHLLHIILQGCGLILLVAAILYVLRLLKIL